MTGNTVNGSGNGARSGAHTLVLLATPLNVVILRALVDGSKQQAELRRATGSPAQTTLRAQLKRLIEIGVIEKRRRNRFPGTLEYELTATGEDLIFVAAVLDRWLDEAPEGPLPIGSNAAKAAIRALTEAWSTTMLRALAARSLSLTELNGVIAALSYPALERRLAALRLAGLVKADPRTAARGTPYTATDWLRRGVAPLAAATRWERRHRPRSTAPIGRLDTEAAFLLTAPLLRLPTEISGSCRVAAEMSNGRAQRLVGVMVEVAEGRVVSCAAKLGGDPDAWALGPSGAWLAAMIENDTDRLELGGNSNLAGAVIDALHTALFTARSQLPLDVGRPIRDDGSN